MSDTPRTDAAYEAAPPANFGGMTAMRNISRELERELIAEIVGRDKWSECAEMLAHAITTGNNHGYGLRIGDDAIAHFEALKKEQP